ncbi:ribosomal L1 domain-containing protein 1-like [Amphibalanus amphitrite]|uniref:ribosomal L1 domain-containing protein 1-like n=1 Tax=Amphibalanus amphitrite TaxID=1232801 RepID=UPI001C8FDBF7|nr:ribosomal L1 domain-containing protein 1-like [Amphibalanus amphitrite]
MGNSNMEEQVKAGIKALLLCKKKLKKEELLNHEDMKVMLQISAIKVAPGRVKQTIKLPLPAPFTDTADVCLFVKDLKRGIRVDHEKSVRHWKDVLDEAGVTRITEVIPLRQLKAEYNMYEARRKLCDSYDVFLSDVRVTRLLPTLLGKHFITKKKQPLSVNMEAKDLVKEIDSVLGAAYLHIHNSGDCSSVQVGRCGQSEEELLQNVMTAVAILRLKFPGGQRNIRSLHLKLGKSPAIPIFVSDVPANSVPVPAARRQPGSDRAPVVGELSTARADSEVIVDRFGNVEVLQKRPLSDDEEESDVEDVEEQQTRGQRGNKRVKLSKTKPVPAGQPSATPEEETTSPAQVPPADEDSEGENSSDEEDRELAAREAQFLDQLAVQKAKQNASGPAVDAAAAKQDTQQRNNKKPSKAKKPTQKATKKGSGLASSGKKAAKKVNVAKSPKADKSATKKYAKKTGKNIGAVKKVK